MLDDIFHCTINALERVEMFLDGGQGLSLLQTSVGDSRDFHGPKVVRGTEAYFDELAQKLRFPMPTKENSLAYY